MKTPLAWLNMLHDKLRTAVALAGVAFACILILMQLGFYSSVLRTATRVYDQLEFDLLLASPDYLYMARASTVSRERLFQAESHPQVAATAPLYLGLNIWRTQDTGLRRGILIMGVDPSRPVFRLPAVNAQTPLLSQSDVVLMDTLSRSEFGSTAPGTQAEVGDTRITIAGNFILGTGFSADGAIISSDLTFMDLLPGRSLDSVSLGLLRLKRGADPKQVAAELAKMLPDDVVIYTRPQINYHDEQHWVVATSVGIIFGLGVIVALIVGVAIVYQVLSSDIDTRLKEYATLKAMGYTRRYLSVTVLKQALLLAIGGFIPGVIISDILYHITASQANVPIEMTPTIAGSVLVLGIVMCSVSGLLSLRKLDAADPADLFA